MSEKPNSARERILRAAAHLFYLKGIRAVSVDAITERAGVTKKTLYYHFSSKDELIANYLAQRDQPNLTTFAKWLREAEGGLPEKIEAFFAKIAEAASHPKWKGCGFLRTISELANFPGHPARQIGAMHKKKVEKWLEAEFRDAGAQAPDLLAAQIAVLIDGAFAAMLVHRDVGYARVAGAAAKSLVDSSV